MIEKFVVSRDDSIYEAFPDVALTPSGRLVCVFAECTHHRDRGFTQVALATSEDRGRTWSSKRVLAEGLTKEKSTDPWWNCPRISTLLDGRLVALCDRIAGRGEGGLGGEQSTWMWLSSDEGDSWRGPIETPAFGIVPDQLIEVRHGPHAGRWILDAHACLGTTR